MGTGEREDSASAAGFLAPGPGAPVLSRAPGPGAPPAFSRPGATPKASVAITDCETLLMAPQLLQLLHAVLHSVRHAHLPSSYKAAEGLTDLLTVLHDFGADEKPHELGAPLATSALVALLPLAQYPQAFASWEDSSLDEDAFMRFRCQELSAVAEIALDEAGLQCATSMSSDAIPFQPR